VLARWETHYPELPGNCKQIYPLMEKAYLNMLDNLSQELIDQEKWLRQNRRILLRTPGSTMILPSMRVLVFAAPTLVGEHQPHQYASIGDKKFVKIQRDKDFVFLLQEDQLCDFIQTTLKLK